MSTRRLASILALLGTLSLAACGGGGGGSAPAAPVLEYRLDGAYGQFTFEGLTAGSRTTPDTVRMAWGSTTSDPAAGTIDATLAVMQTGLASLGLERSSSTYAPLPSGRLQIGDFRGGMSDNPGPADVAALAAIQGNPGISLFVRRPAVTTTPALADLAGAYHVAILIHSDASDLETVGWGRLTLDGAGTATDVWLAYNAAGTAVAGAPAPNGTYGVGADNAMELTLAGLRFTGVYLGTGGDLMVLGGATTSIGNRQSIAILMPVATAATSTEFAGTYDVVNFASTRTTGGLARTDHFVSSLGSFVANGTGAITSLGELVVNRDGVAETFTPSSGAASSYVVTPSGQLLVGTAPGFMSPDGRFAVSVVDAGAAGRPPQLSFLLRVR